MQSETLLKATGLRVSYGSFEVIKGVDLTVPRGGSLAIIGPNGAGKSTLFKALTGEIECSAGEIVFRGKNVTKMPAYLRTIEGMGRTFQVSRVFLELSVRENLIVALEARQKARGQRKGSWWQTSPAAAIVSEAEALLDQLGIYHLRHDQAAVVSHGDRKRLELALALALEPEVLMLDEPTAGMAPADRMRIVDLILGIRQDRNISVVMTEHDMDVIFSIADAVTVLNYGELIASGTVEEIRNSEEVRKVYLGKDMYHAEA